MIYETLLFSMAFSLILATIITGVYFYVHKDCLMEEMVLTLLLLPLVVCTIIYSIGNNVAGAFSLAGIFTIVRFRSTQASPKDITYILLGVSVGLTSAMFLYKEAIILMFFSILIIMLLEKTSTKNTRQVLKILIPEDLINSGDIDLVLKKYTTYSYMESMVTKDLGSLFELVYRLNLPNNTNYQEMIDELRIINGNLTIKLTK